MEIKDVSHTIHWEELDANIFEDGRFFCATSSDSKWCCTGMIVDHQVYNQNPLLRIHHIYKEVISWK